MKLHTDIRAFARYQILGFVGIVILLIALTTSFFVIKHHFDSQARLEVLKERSISDQQARLETEVTNLIDYVRFMRGQAKDLLQKSAKVQVEQAHQTARSIYLSLHQKHSEAFVKQAIKQALRGIRFANGRGYIFIYDQAGQSIMRPMFTHREGRSSIDLKDDTGKFIVREFIDIASRPESSGFAFYRWYVPGSSWEMADKIAYVKKFEPYGWIIGSGDYLKHFEEDLKASVIKRIKAIQFGKTGHLTLLNQSGFVLASSLITPTGSGHYLGLDDVQQRDLIQRLLAVATPQGSVTEHYGLRASSATGDRKVAYVRSIPEWNWVLVASFYTNDVKDVWQRQEKGLQQAFIDDTFILVIVLIVAGVITLLLAFWFSRWSIRLLQHYQEDIERKQTILTNNAHELQIAARVFDTSAEGIMVTNTVNEIVAVNTAFCTMTGFSETTVLGKDPKFLSSGQHDSDFFQAMWKTLLIEDKWQGEVWNRRNDGSVAPDWLTIAVSRNEKGDVVNYISTLVDITERKQHEAQLRYLAEYDALTDLPNRRLLSKRVEQTIATASRKSSTYKFALMFIDLDRFKNINDSLGHGVGDKVLTTVAQRLLSAVRTTDVVSRLGGDEFVILMVDDNLPRAAAILAQRLNDIIAEPIVEGSQELVVTPSVGVATYPENGQDFDTLLRNADAALYHAKDLGRNNFQFYTEEMNEKVSARLSLEHALRQALSRNEFELHYQPQYSLASQQLIGCEALIRWQREEGGLVSPDQFIPIAEETGLILPIGDWVLQSACTQGARWIEKGYPALPIAVNVSAHQFTHGLVNKVEEALFDTGFPTHLLMIEVTESALMKDAEMAAETLDQLKALGVGIALDDFGTGYSSLAYLKRFSLDKLKIDRTFISGLPADNDDKAITTSIIDVARNLRLATVAEGIETSEQQHFLADALCDEAQGYLFAKPLSGADMDHLLSSYLRQT